MVQTQTLYKAKDTKLIRSAGGRGGGLEILLQFFLTVIFVKTLYKAKGTELIRFGGGRGLKILLQFLQLFLVQALYKAKDTGAHKALGSPQNPLTILTIFFGTDLI